MFSHDFVVDTMRELGAKSFNPMKFSFEPKKFSSLGITLIRNLFKWIEKHIIFRLKTKKISASLKFLNTGPSLVNDCYLK